jgi:hypothetical protein
MNFAMTVRRMGLVLTLPVALAACSGMSKPTTTQGPVSYGDAKAVDTVDEKFGSTDLQLIAEKMTQSMLESPVLTGRPTISVEKVKNKTNEYIDTVNITNTIQNALLKSGKVRFVRSRSEMAEGAAELQRQQQSGMYNSKGAAKAGNFVAAKYTLEGEFTKIEKQNSSAKDVYFKFTLKMFDVSQGTIEWMEEKEIRKTVQK